MPACAPQGLSQASTSRVIGSIEQRRHACQRVSWGGAEPPGSNVVQRELKAANYQTRDVEIEECEAGSAGRVATLLSTDASPDELDAIVSLLKNMPGVQHVSWTARMVD